MTAWAAGDRLILGASPVRDGSNEVSAILKLLRTMDLDAAIVTIDAAGRQVETARIIRDRERNYLLAE